jgi:hypothetical protein
MTSSRSQTPKSLWTHDDFEQMCWHDCRLHAFGMVDDFDPHEHEVRLDIDYIFQWVCTEDGSGVTGFWIAPATLVFPASETKVTLDDLAGWWITGIERVDPRPAYPGGPVEWTWKIAFSSGGSIVVRSLGFAQYTRRTPVFVACPDQCLESHQRGGLSLEKRLYDEAPPS